MLGFRVDVNVLDIVGVSFFVLTGLVATFFTVATGFLAVVVVFLVAVVLFFKVVLA